MNVNFKGLCKKCQYCKVYRYDYSDLPRKPKSTIHRCLADEGNFRPTIKDKTRYGFADGFRVVEQTERVPYCYVQQVG